MDFDSTKFHFMEKDMTINSRYLNLMHKATGVQGQKSLMRIKELWWGAFLQAFSVDPIYAIDNLDVFMDANQKQFRLMAAQYSEGDGAEIGSEEHIQKTSQFLKSNTGKMFERFIGLAIAHYLNENQSNYCIWAFRKDLNSVCSFLNIDKFTVQVNLGNKKYKTTIDSDLIIFNPDNKDADIYLISVKSTLKDRFHNVPFWNLLRLASLANTPPNLSTENGGFLSSVKYIAVCSDLAEEQPDFSNETGPRNLLCIDAALLDGAYVTSSRAKGLGSDSLHLGPNRKAPFYPLSKFVEHLCV